MPTKLHDTRVLSFGTTRFIVGRAARVLFVLHTRPAAHNYNNTRRFPSYGCVAVNAVLAGRLRDIGPVCRCRVITTATGRVIYGDFSTTGRGDDYRDYHDYRVPLSGARAVDIPRYRRGVLCGPNRCPRTGDSKRIGGNRRVQSASLDILRLGVFYRRRNVVSDAEKYGWHYTHRVVGKRLIQYCVLCVVLQSKLKKKKYFDFQANKWIINSCRECRDLYR